MKVIHGWTCKIHGVCLTIPALIGKKVGDNEIVTGTIRQVNCVVASEHAKSVPQSRRAAQMKCFPSCVQLRLSAPFGRVSPSGTDIDARGAHGGASGECESGHMERMHPSSSIRPT